MLHTCEQVVLAMTDCTLGPEHTPPNCTLQSMEQRCRCHRREGIPFHQHALSSSTLRPSSGCSPTCRCWR